MISLHRHPSTTCTATLDDALLHSRHSHHGDGVASASSPVPPTRLWQHACKFDLRRSPLNRLFQKVRRKSSFYLLGLQFHITFLQPLLKGHEFVPLR
jgi:hypothetical protein